MSVETEAATVAVVEPTEAKGKGAAIPNLITVKFGDLEIPETLLNSWDFDSLQYSIDQLVMISPYFFTKTGLLEHFNVSTEKFALFVRELSSKYIAENSYHNYSHAVDVLHAVYHLTMVSHMHKAYTKLEMYSLLIAAVGHDVGHLSVNNVYLVKSKHHLAITYNDASPLENMHCAELYRIILAEETNIFAEFTDAQYRESRKMILPCILGTDMTAHFTQIKEVQAFHAAEGAELVPFTSGSTDEIPAPFLLEEKRLFMMVISLHCADISNPYKHFDVCRRWADLIVYEFCAQGDREKAEGLEISPMCDRDTLNLYNMQMGFIEFVVSPLLNGFINLLPALHMFGDVMKDNFTSWGELRKDEIRGSGIENKDEEVAKIDGRIEKFGKTMAYLDKMKESCQAASTSSSNP